MKLFIKNMVCDRCKMVVTNELKQLGLHPQQVTLGTAELQEEQLSAEQSAQLNSSLQLLGFELIADPKSRIIEKIKNVIIGLIHYQEGNPEYKYSDILSKELNADYSHLSKLFSETEGITIEHYIIAQKVEKVKEYLAYGELSQGEIADLLGYSSTAHLSSQFKKITGLTPGQFRKDKENNRLQLDKIGLPASDTRH
jgi:AraC-like DNA-binding protein